MAETNFVRVLLGLIFVGSAFQFFHLFSVGTPTKSASSSMHVKQQKEQNQKPPLLLSVPFCVCDHFDWDNATFPVFQNECPQFKHSVDHWFAHAATRHPLRTFNPQEAKLFVIPFMMNAVSERVYTGRTKNRSAKYVCIQDLCDYQLLDQAAQAIWNTKNPATNKSYFEESPHLHVAVASHCYAAYSSWPNKGDLVPPLDCNSHLIGFESYRPSKHNRKRLLLPGTHIGKACPETISFQNKSSDFALIASMQAKFQDRKNICQWLKDGRKSISVCGGGQQCPALEYARFGFHVKGDTFGSNRLMDALLTKATVVPIFTRKEQYKILPWWIDFANKLSFYADASNAAAFQQGIDKILTDDDYRQAYEQRLAAITANRHLFDWTSLYPFDHYMYMVQAHEYPKTRHDPRKMLLNTTNSALILPEPEQ